MESGAVVIRASKTKAAWLLVCAAILSVAGLILIRNDDHAWIGWICAPVFGLCVLVSIGILGSNLGDLRIDRDGIELKALFRPIKFTWNELDCFRVEPIFPGVSRTKVIRIEFSATYRSPRAGRQLDRFLTGMDGALADQFDRPVEDVCELLNAARSKWANVRHDKT